MSDRTQDRLPEALREVDDLKQEVARLKIQLRQSFRQIESLMVDGLTGIYNRAGLNLVLDQTLKSDTATIIYIDLDKFKPINDTYEHDAGDEALKQVGQLLNENIKSDTDIVALLEKQHGLSSKKKSQKPINRPTDAMQGLNTRIGGDEFVIALDGVTEQNAQSVLDRIMNAFEGLNFNWSDTNIKIEASFGMATYNKGESFEAAKARADKSMYEQKRQKGPSRR